MSASDALEGNPKTPLVASFVVTAQLLKFNSNFTYHFNFQLILFNAYK